MRLSFDVGYEDYSDEANWLPHKQQLMTLVQKLDKAYIAELEDAVLLDAMEQVEELMRYYAAVTDYGSLEPVMRLQEELLQLGQFRKVQETGFTYLEMEFARINALLYRSEKMNREAMNETDVVCEKALLCFSKLKQENSLKAEQIIYLGWACVECLNEAIQIYDVFLNIEAVHSCRNHAVCVLDWIQPYLSVYPGILERAADLYCTYGGNLYQCGEPIQGRDCFEKAITLLHRIGREQSDSFWMARSVFAKALYSLQELLYTGNTKLLYECEQEAKNILEKQSHYTNAILTAVLGMISVQKGKMSEQKGQIEWKIRETRSGCEQLQQATHELESDKGIRNSFYTASIRGIAARIFAFYVGALDEIGVCLYQKGSFSEAKETFVSILKSLNKNKDYQLGEQACSMMRAECSQFLALIAVEEQNVDEAEFYGEQAYLLAVELTVQTENVNALAIQTVCCNLLSALSFAEKEKKKAAQYAAQGICAAVRLRALVPEHPALVLQSSLERLQKKANRRFF